MVTQVPTEAVGIVESFCAILALVSFLNITMFLAFVYQQRCSINKCLLAELTYAQKLQLGSICSGDGTIRNVNCGCRGGYNTCVGMFLPMFGKYSLISKSLVTCLAGIRSVVTVTAKVLA